MAVTILAIPPALPRMWHRTPFVEEYPGRLMISMTSKPDHRRKYSFCLALLVCLLLELSHQTFVESCTWGGIQDPSWHGWVPSWQCAPTYQPCKWAVLKVTCPAPTWTIPLNATWYREDLALPAEPGQNVIFEGKIKDCYCFKTLCLG